MYGTPVYVWKNGKVVVQAFAAIAVIDSSGTINEFLPMPNSAHLRCFTTEMVGRKYPKPPVSPFYERFRIGHPVM